jgi:type VII secretion protein EccE
VNGDGAALFPEPGEADSQPDGAGAAGLGLTREASSGSAAPGLPAAPAPSASRVAAARAGAAGQARDRAKAAAAAAARASTRNTAPGTLKAPRTTDWSGGAAPRQAASAAGRPRRWGKLRQAVRGIGLGQVLCWQAAAAAVIAVVGQRKPVVVTVAVVAAGVVAATAIRIQGRWLYEWLARAARFIFRGHRGAVVSAEDPADHLLGMVAQHTVVEAVDLDGVPVALIHHPSGVTAVLEPHTPGGPHEEGLTMSALRLTSPFPLLPPPDVDAPSFTAQLITHAARPPVSQVVLGAAPFGRRGTPRQRTWIALQAVRSPEIYLDEDLTKALANAVRRLVRRLARDELPTRALDRDEALSLLVGLAHLDEATTGPEPGTVRETWRTWDAGPTTQACFRIGGWQDVGENDRQLLLHRLHQVPSLATTVAIAARRGGRRTEAQVDIVIRIAEVSQGRLDNSAGLLAFAVDSAGAEADDGTKVRLERLDGDHLAAVAASLPFGGFVGD